MVVTLSDIAALLGLATPNVGGGTVITGMNTLIDAGPGELSFIGSDQFARQFAHTRAAAVLVQKKVAVAPRPDLPTFTVDDADLAVAKVLTLFAPPVERPTAGVHASASIAPTASVGANARIGTNVFIGDGVTIGSNAVLHPGVHIAGGTIVGDDCEFFPNVVVRDRVRIGSRVVINAGSVIGTDGFGYRWDGRQHAKIPQIGTVVIEDDVEIGSCVCIDRAKFAATVIGRGTKIDNLVQVAHNCVIGPHCILAGQTGLAGSATLGAGVVLGGQVAIRDHITLGDGAMVAATSGVAEDVPPKEIVAGTPALPRRQALREQGALRRLPELVNQVRKLQEQVDTLQAKQGS